MEVLHEQIVMLQADRAAAQEADEAPRRGSGRTWQALGHGTGQHARGGHWDVEHGCGTHGGVDKAGQLSLVHPPRRQAHMTEAAHMARGGNGEAASTPRRPLITRRKRRDLAYGCTNR